MKPADMRVAVVIASIGRATELQQWTERLAAQTHPPHRVVYSVVRDSDLPAAELLYPGGEVVMGTAGLPAQRNRAMERVLNDCDLIAFFDDDYVPARSCIARAAELFAANPGIAGANGLLLADGIHGPGIDYGTALATVDFYDTAVADPIRIEHDLEGLYGCNMVYRSAMIGAVRFDERLPLYAWQEDIDFAVQVSACGRIVKSNAFAGVHQGAKGGRGSGLRLGYSQIANPFYLWRKGTMSRSFALRLMAGNVISNHVKSLRPEPWVDRLGRMRGNWLGLADALLGRLKPERILQL